MRLTDSTTLYHFKQFIESVNFRGIEGKPYSEKYMTDVYENKIIKFLNSWLEFNKKRQNNKIDTVTKISDRNIVDYALYQIFGERYFTNLIKHITPKLNRFRHILYEEDVKEFDAAFEDLLDNNKVIIAPKVLDKTEKHNILITFKRMFDFYKSIYQCEGKRLLKLFDDVIGDISMIYLESNYFTDKSLPFIETNIFYGTSFYGEIREKALVILYEFLARFYERMDISPYSNNAPVSQYIKDFYKIQKAIVSNNILYIFLKNSQNVLVYDFTNKIAKDPKNPLYDTKLQKYEVVDSHHRLYFLKFNKGVNSIVYNDDTLMVSLDDGTILINGKNTNNKIHEDSTEEFAKFIYFDTSIIKKEIKSIKIVDKHIYVMTKNNFIYIYGKLDDTSCIKKKDCEMITECIHKKNINGFEDFTVSQDSSRIIYMTKDMVGKYYINDTMTLSIKSDKVVIITCEDEHKNMTVYEYNLETKHPNIVGSNIFKLKNDAFLIEAVDKKENPQDNEYYYYIIGKDPKKTYRLGFNDDDFQNESSIKELHDISPFIQLTKDNRIDKRIRVTQMHSFKTRTLLLTTAGIIFGAGQNKGFFIDRPDPELYTFTRLTMNEYREHIDDFCATRYDGKNLIFAYNETLGYGFGPFYFFGMKHGGDFIFDEYEINEKLADTESDNVANSNKMAYFCTTNCMYYLNPVYDLISYFYLMDTKFGNDSIDHVKKSLKYLEDMSVMHSEKAYEHLINNLNIINEEVCKTNMGINHNLGYFSNLQNYAMHDAMMYMYAKNKESYGSISSFINLMGLMGENYSAMETKHIKMGDMSREEFNNYLNDINYEMKFEKEKLYERNRKNRFRAS